MYNSYTHMSMKMQELYSYGFYNNQQEDSYLHHKFYKLYPPKEDVLYLIAVQNPLLFYNFLIPIYLFFQFSFSGFDTC